MGSRTARMTAPELQKRLAGTGEIALVDAREEGDFATRHLFLASSLPLSRLEFLAPSLLPRRGVPIVVCDNGEGLGERAAARLAEGGYGEASLLEGGIEAWGASGFPLYSGAHVPSKAFAEVVEHHCATPSIGAEELERLLRKGEKIRIFDSRSFAEYHANSIPGAVSVPGAELLYRFADLVLEEDALVVVNCGGRTRSIIGAESLIEAGVPNRVVSLRDGTMGWHLAGFEVIRGAERRAPSVSPRALAFARERAQNLARRFSLPQIDRETLEKWRRESETRSLYCLDVRDPAEYESGHLPGSLSAPGGQLVQETDAWLAVRGARVVLIDNEGVRAPMTAFWLRRMGFEASVLEGGIEGSLLERGFPAPVEAFPLAGPEPQALSPEALSSALQEKPSPVVVDLALSPYHRGGHIPGARFAIRSRLGEALASLAAATDLVFTSEEGFLARHAAAEIAALSGRKAAILAGGTEAWRKAGLPLEKGMDAPLCEPGDVALPARDRPRGEREKAMRDYLSWEKGLAEAMAREPDCRFDLAAKAG